MKVLSAFYKNQSKAYLHIKQCEAPKSLNSFIKREFWKIFCKIKNQKKRRVIKFESCVVVYNDRPKWEKNYVA